MLNLEQTKSLFDKEAILFFNCNVISKKRAEELLGTDAVKAAIQFGQGGQDYNSFCGKKLELSYQRQHANQIPRGNKADGQKAFSLIDHKSQVDYNISMRCMVCISSPEFAYLTLSHTGRGHSGKVWV